MLYGRPNLAETAKTALDPAASPTTIAVALIEAEQGLRMMDATIKSWPAS